MRTPEIPDTGTARGAHSARRASARIAIMYAAYAVIWVVGSDWVLARLGLPDGVEQAVASGKGVAFVLFTAAVLYAVLRVYLGRLRATENELHGQEGRIRQAYVDVLDAVTGGKLVLVTDTELTALLGDRRSGPTPIEDASQLSAARAEIRSAVEPIDAELASSMNLASSVGEALTNALKHGGRGAYGVCETATLVQVRVDDEGPGIDFRTLPKATLLAGFSTTSTMGLGFTLMLQLSERVLLSTRPGGTTVVLEFPKGALPVAPSLAEQPDRLTASV